MRNPIASAGFRLSVKAVGIVYGMLGLVLLTILPVVGLVRLRGERIDGEIALAIPLLTLAALRGSPRHLAVTAWYGALLGLLLVGMGVGHLVGVTSVATGLGRSYDSRHVFLLTIGGILICAGLFDVAASRAIRRGTVVAIAHAGFRTMSLIAFLVLLLPLPDGGGNTSGFLVLNVAYLTLLTFDWLSRPLSPGSVASHLTTA
jgi:hypothetical protein